jgi:hypothetical protein
MAVISVLGQAQCKYAINKTDDFTGEKILQTKNESILIAFLRGNEPCFYWAFKRTINKGKVDYYITGFYERDCQSKDFGDYRRAFKIGQKMMLKLDNDSLISLSGEKENKSYWKKNDVFGLYMAGWYLDNEYHLTKHQIEMLSQHKIVKARVYYYDLQKDAESIVEYTAGSLTLGIGTESVIKLVDCLAAE